MKVFIHNYRSAAMNLAYEDWLFSAFEEEMIRLWINPRAVVVGKHQNALAEANVQFCRSQDIPVLRRISGGGTVYHDPGNVNFSFFRMVNKDKMIDYDRNLEWIQSALRLLGYPVDMNERHDLFLGERKVSGNAQHLKKGRALHHGTILYDADRSALSKAIKRPSGTFTDKSVQSVRSTIDNLKPTSNLGSCEAFLNQIRQKLIEQGAESCPAPVPEEGVLEELVSTKYSADSWNFGYSPNYQYSNSNQHFAIELSVARGGKILEGTMKRAIGDEQIKSHDLTDLYHFPSAMETFINMQELEPQDQASLREILY